MNITDQIRDLDITNILSTEGIELRRAGNNFVGLCPFHSEKNPSFTVFQDNRAKCWGCGWSGDPLDFIMSLRNLGFNEALSYLGINREPLSKEDWRKIQNQKLQVAQHKLNEARERDLAYTLAFLIRSAYKALKHITRDNLNEFGETLDALPWWEYCHETLCSGSSDEKASCCEELKDMPTIKRNTAFKPDFDLGQWARGTMHG